MIEPTFQYHQLSEEARLLDQLLKWIVSSGRANFLTRKQVFKLLRPIFGQSVLDEVRDYYNQIDEEQSDGLPIV
jgi:hypothetical protein